MTCQELIAREIPPQGSISFARFMELALYAPEVGYYNSGIRRVGGSGDFYTSVSVGPALGAVLASLYEEMWTALGKPQEFFVVEQGADDGQLAADVLTAASPEFLHSLRYAIVEPLPTLKEIQKSRLSDWPVIWFDSLQDMPEFEGVHFSNELVDAMPFHLLCSDGSHWKEMQIRHGETGFEFTETQLPENLYALTDHFPTRPAGYLTEIRPVANLWIKQVANRLKRGFLLVLDYGLSREQLLREDRVRGTFASFRAHRSDDHVLEDPGQKDITAHVDFTALADAGFSVGFKACGFCDQHHFLVGAATALLRSLDGQMPTDANTKFLRALKALMHPESMGTQFFAFCLTAGLPDPIPLSAFRDGVVGFKKVLV